MTKTLLNKLRRYPFYIVQAIIKSDIQTVLAQTQNDLYITLNLISPQNKAIYTLFTKGHVN